MNNNINNIINDYTTNGEFILQHLSKMEMEISPTTMVFSPTKQWSLSPGSFLITPDRDFSLVSGHTLASWNVEFAKWAPGSEHIGQVATPSGRNVLAIGFVQAKVNMTVRFAFGAADNTEVAGFKDVKLRVGIHLLVYASPANDASSRLANFQWYDQSSNYCSDPTLARSDTN
ncbi:hypothetical protein B0T20DRAFT_389954 [Sordaria brevicollis]|uniref:Uncharacterized protein n=1 Tax=Sordaria brevicollis TaxID=83679 RepID=A0AAE0PLJ9_SORBR|nr:hypothetical protein B0T20DRAFT_389954 [Sordaria brevicollis]